MAQWIKDPVLSLQWLEVLLRHTLDPQRRLKIWHCHSCSVRCSCCSELIPGQGTSICGCGPKKKINKQINRQLFPSLVVTTLSKSGNSKVPSLDFRHVQCGKVLILESEIWWHNLCN